VRHNNRTVLQTKAEDEVKNTIPVRLTTLNVKSSFIITYRKMPDANDRNKWVRSIGLYTESDSVLCSRKSSSIKIADTVLKKMLKQNRVIKVYTWAVPKDPVEAARVRIRRVHLCTFELN